MSEVSSSWFVLGAGKIGEEVKEKKKKNRQILGQGWTKINVVKEDWPVPTSEEGRNKMVLDSSSWQKETESGQRKDHERFLTPEKKDVKLREGKVTREEGREES